MARGLPVLIATRSGEILGDKVARAMTEHMFERIDKIQHNRKEFSNSRNARYEAEQERIEAIREHNREQFHIRRGEFRLRPVLLDNYGNGDPQVILADYDIGGKGKITTNSVRGKDVFVIGCPYEPIESLDRIIESLKFPTPEQVRSVLEQGKMPIKEVLESLGQSPTSEQLKKVLELERDYTRQIEGLDNLYPSPEKVRAVLEHERKFRSVSENLVEIFLLCYTLKKNDAGSVTLLSPEFPTQLQDHSREREASTAKMVATILEMLGVERIISVDLHSAQIAEFANIPIEHLRASSVMIPELEKTIGYTPETASNYIFISPDAGGTARANYMAKRWGCGVAISNKERDYAGKSKVKRSMIIGDVEGKIAIMLDDVIASAGTMESGIREAKRRGTIKNYLYCTHLVLSGDGLNTINKLYKEGIIDGVFVTDTVPRPASFYKEHPFIHLVSVDSILAKTAYNITMERSVGGVHEGTGKILKVRFEN